MIESLALSFVLLKHNDVKQIKEKELRLEARVIGKSINSKTVKYLKYNFDY